MQLRAHARAAFASQTNGSMNYPFTMLFHVELAKERSRVRDNRFKFSIGLTSRYIAKVRFRPEPGSRRFFGLRAKLGSAPFHFTWQIPSHKGT